MARRAEPLGAAGISGGAALALVAIATLGPVLALAARAGGGLHVGPADLAALRFTLAQAAASALASVALALPLARALARRRFPGRDLLATLLAAPFLVPSIAAALAVAAAYGRSGPVADALAALGLPRPDIYGPGGVVLAHLFLNLGLVLRMLLQGYARVPAEHWKLAAALGLSPRATFRAIEAAVLREVLPGAALVVFLVCSTSFAVVLALGGGPAATTVELAIYEALRLDFDPGRAAALALVQSALCLAAGGALLALGRGAAQGPGVGALPVRHDAPGGAARLADAAAILVGAAFLLLPLGLLVAAGLPALRAGLPAPVWAAAGRSLAIALPSAALAVALALAIAGPVVRLRRRGHRLAGPAEAAGLLALAASPIAVGTGLFLLLRPIADPFALALPVTLGVNALMSLPFALRLLAPALERAEADWGRLAAALGMTGPVRFRLVTWPAIRPALGTAAGLAAALSAGDLGVIALFAPADAPTLPLAVQRLMGAYRMGEAAGASLLLLGLCLGLFAALDRGGRLGARA